MLVRGSLLCKYIALYLHCEYAFTKGVPMTASESDFPFDELDKEFNQNLVDEFNGYAEQNERSRKVTLEPHDNNDPMYQAQILAQELDLPQPFKSDPLYVPSVPVRDFLGTYAVEQLNSRYASDSIRRQLAISARNLRLIKPDGKSNWWDEGAVVTGLFEGFDFLEARDGSTLFVLLDNPRFINPNYINEGYAKTVQVPVLGINEWRIVSKNT